MTNSEARPGPLTGLGDPPSVAIVGAGMAGLACARALVDAGMSLTIVDKGRVPGGRVSTRHAGGIAFDHGAQYVTARDPEFERWLADCRAKGMAGAWRGAIAYLGPGDGGVEAKQRWVGVPGMSALAQHLAAGLRIMSGVRIAAVHSIGAGWRLISDEGESIASADVVILAIPAPQAIALLDGAPALAARIADAAFEPCWSVMLAFEHPLDLPFDAAFAGTGPLSWICRDASKPGRYGAETWVLHASPAWSTRHLEADPESVEAALADAFANLTAADMPGAILSRAHRWRYARVSKPLGEASLFDPDLRIGACGDWCLGGKIEAAYLSGKSLGERVLGFLMPGMVPDRTDSLQRGKER